MSPSSHICRFSWIPAAELTSTQADHVDSGVTHRFPSASKQSLIPDKAEIGLALLLEISHCHECSLPILILHEIRKGKSEKVRILSVENHDVFSIYAVMNVRKMAHGEII